MSATIERTIKSVVVSAGSKKGYPFSVARIVECRVDQRGHKTEKGVRVLYESEPLYRPTTRSGRGKGPETIRRYKELAREELENVLLY